MWIFRALVCSAIHYEPALSLNRTIKFDLTTEPLLLESIVINIFYLFTLVIYELTPR